MSNPKSRPEIAEKLSNIDDYGTVFIGFLIWWYVAPTIINTFVESYDFSEKTIVPFATSGGSTEVYKEMLPKALENSITPVMVKEIVYQATDYLGYGRMLPFLNCTNRIFAEKDIPLPLDGQPTTTLENRLEKGIEAQAEIFGEHMKGTWKTGHINRWLAANCFGDYYTRKGLNLAERELITFCFLMQGGCEPQLIAHAKGNMNMGNDKDFLIRVVSGCLPYIGYPRSLNAIACAGKAVEK